jgi:hypothetical protein
MFALSPHGEHQFRAASAKPPMTYSQTRDCRFCGQPELRGCFRNDRCRQCRKAQA